MAGGVDHPPSLFHPLYEKLAHAGALDWLKFGGMFDDHQAEVFFDALICSALTISALIVLVWKGRGNLQKVPGKLQNLLEVAIIGLRRMTTDMLGPDGPKYLPLMGTVFLYILSNNLIGLLPGMKPPTMTASTTFALGLTMFLCVQTIAIRANGIVGYLKHFAGDLLAFAPLMFVIHVAGELAKPMSLSLRLYGNIFAEDNVIAVLTAMGFPAWLPLQLPMLAFGLFTSFLQAFIFTSLSCIYVQGFVEHAGHDAHGEGHGRAHRKEHAHAH